MKTRIILVGLSFCLICPMYADSSTKLNEKDILSILKRSANIKKSKKKTPTKKRSAQTKKKKIYKKNTSSNTNGNVIVNRAKNTSQKKDDSTNGYVSGVILPTQQVVKKERLKEMYRDLPDGEFLHSNYGNERQKDLRDKFMKITKTVGDASDWVNMPIAPLKTKTKPKPKRVAKEYHLTEESSISKLY